MLKNHWDFSEKNVPRVSHTHTVNRRHKLHRSEIYCRVARDRRRSAARERESDKSATGENPDSRMRKSLRARNEGCAVSFIAAFPAVYRDSLANGKRHNGHDGTRMEQRVDATRRGQVSPGVARCIALVTSFAGVGSDKETPPPPRRWQSGTSEAGFDVCMGYKTTANRSYSPIDPKNAFRLS